MDPHAEVTVDMSGPETEALLEAAADREDVLERQLRESQQEIIALRATLADEQRLRVVAERRAALAETARQNAEARGLATDRRGRFYEGLLWCLHQEVIFRADMTLPVCDVEYRAVEEGVRGDEVWEASLRYRAIVSALVNMGAPASATGEPDGAPSGRAEGHAAELLRRAVDGHHAETRLAGGAE